MTWRRLILQSLERSVFLCGSIKIAMLDLSKKGIPSLVAMGGDFIYGFNNKVPSGGKL